MNTMLRRIRSFLHVIAVLGLSIAGLTCCGIDAVAYGAGRGAEIRDPCDGTGAGTNAPSVTDSTRPKRPNVLLIGIETLRADHVGCLGCKRDTTPTLDRLAREGVLCTRTMSASGWTLPSVMSVMTSLYPGSHKVHTYENKLASEVTTLAEVLKTGGYTTVGFVSNPTIDGQYGFSDGFDLYDDFTVQLDFGMDIFGEHDKVIEDKHLARTSEPVTRVAKKWLERKPAEPFFMFVFYFDPHYDYMPPAPFDTLFDPNYKGDMDGHGIVDEPRHSQRPADRDLQHLQALYDGEIRYTDTYVAKLLQTFAEGGLLENTLIVVFGDHGEEFYEHGKTGHERTLYNEIVRVPLILWQPGRLPAGKRMDALTSLVDVMPTILDYASLPYEGPMQGYSLRPLVEGKADKLHDTVWAELNYHTHVRAVMNEHYKLVRDLDQNAWELYQQDRDPGEHDSLSEQPSAANIRLALTTEWEQWTKTNDDLANKLTQGTKTEKPQISEQQLLQLKALGYMQ